MALKYMLNACTKAFYHLCFLVYAVHSLCCASCTQQLCSSDSIKTLETVQLWHVTMQHVLLNISKIFPSSQFLLNWLLYFSTIWRPPYFSPRLHLSPSTSILLPDAFKIFFSMLLPKAIILKFISDHVILLIKKNCSWTVFITTIMKTKSFGYCISSYKSGLSVPLQASFSATSSTFWVNP